MPAFSVFAGTPLCFSEMVKPGPTVPTRRGVAIGAAGEVASSATAPAAMSVQMVFMRGLRPAETTGLLRDREAALHDRRVRIADERVLALPHPDDHRLGPDEGDRGDLPVDPGPTQTEVVDVRLVRAGDRVAPRLDHLEGPVEPLHADREPRPDRPGQLGQRRLRSVRRGDDDECAGARSEQRERAKPCHATPSSGVPACQDRGRMRVQELATGLWRWTGLHPAWTPAGGGPDGWEQEVGSYYYEAPESIVLFDPLVPMEDRDRFFEALDRDVARAGRPVRVLVTVEDHRRSAAELAERYAATLAEVPAGVQIVLDRWDEQVYWIPEHAALVFGDLVLARDGRL